MIERFQNSAYDEDGIGPRNRTNREWRAESYALAGDQEAARFGAFVHGPLPGEGEEPIGDRTGKQAIGQLVAALSSLDQVRVHLIPTDGGGFVRRLSHGMSQSPGDLVNLRAKRRQGQALPAFGLRFSLRTELDGPLDRVQAG